MVARPLMALAALFFTAGAIVLIFFTLLPGAVNNPTMTDIYFLRADTSGIQGAPPVSQWTLWNVCDGSGDGRNKDCGPVKPAYPFDPPRNFNTEEGVPEQFLGTRQYFYLTRFMFAFILIGLFFAALSLLMGLGATCWRLGGALSGLIASFALFWQAAASALMTAAYVKGRDNFRRSDQTASLGQKAFGFMWAATACLFLATVLYFAILGTGKKDTTHSSKGGLFGRKKNNPNRGSFIDHNRVIKDDETTSFERSRF